MKPRTPLFRGVGWLAFFCCTLIAARAQTTLYYDTSSGNGFPSNTSFTWNTTTSAWNNSATGASSGTKIAWNNASLNDASIGNGSGTGTYTATLGTSITVGRILKVNGTWKIALGSNTLTFNSGTDWTNSMVMSGTGGIVKAGANTLTLTGTNTYSGPTAIQAGTLSINSISNVNGSNSALGRPTSAANGTIKIGSTTTGATLRYTGATASTNRVIDLAGTTGGATLDASGTGALTFTSAFTATGAGAKTLTLTGSSTANNTISGNIVNNSGSNVTSLVKSGNGTWVLTGNKSYTGSTEIQAGTLSVNSLANAGSASSLGAASGPAASIKIGNGANTGTLRYTGAATSTNRVIDLAGTTGGATLDASGTGALTFTSNFTASGAGAKTLTLTGTSTANNTIQGAIVDNSVANPTSLVKSGNGTWVLSGNNTYTGTTTVSAGTLQIGAGGTSGSVAGTSLVNNAALVFNRSDALTYGGTISGSGTVTKNGAGTLTLTGNNSYTGATTISAGTLQVGAGGTSGSLASSGITNNGALVFNRSDAASYAGTISGSGTVTQAGTGALTLSGNNTYSGGTTLSSGTLALGSNTAIGTGALSIASGTTIQASGGARTLANNITVGGNFSIGGANDLTLNGTFNLGGGTRTLTVDNTGFTTIAGSITQPYYSGLVKAGAGTLVLSGNNSYSAPTTVSEGTLVLANNNALGASGTWGQIVSSGATLALQGGVSVSQGGFTIDGTGYNNTGALRNISGSNTLGGQLTFNSNTSIVSDAGTLTLTGNPQIGGNTITVGGAGDVVMSGAANGSGGITKTGTGKLTLSGSSANSFNNLSVDDGTVLLSKTAGTNAVGGSGAIVVGNSVGAANSAILRLGANEQIPNSAASFTINSDGQFDLNNFTETIDRLSGTGSVALGTSGALTVGASSNSSTFDGTISGGGTLTKAGSGTFTVTGANSYTGATTISQGTLQIGAGGTSGSLASSTIANSGSLVFNRSDAVTYAGTISGSGTVVQNGSGTLTLSGNNSYTGTTTVNLGTLKLGSAGSAGNGPLGTTAAGTVVNAGGALDLNGFTLANAEALSIQGSGVNAGGALTNSSATAASYSGVVTLANDAAIGGTGNITLTSGISDNGTGRTLTKVGSGTLTLNAAATLWSGGSAVNVSNGTFAVGTTNALGTYGAPGVTVNATAPGTTATFATNSLANQSIQSLTFGGAGATSTSTNAVTLGGGSTLTLGGNVTYDATNNPLGAAISGSGTLALGSSSRTFDVANSTNAATDLAVSANLSGSGALVKNGAGTLGLSGTNTGFTGGVVVNAGTLAATGSTNVGGFGALGNYSGLVSPTTVVTVNSGATLAVNGGSNTTYSSATEAMKNLTLNGSGDNGGGALRSTGGASTWTGNITLGSDATITNTGGAGAGADVLYLGAWIYQNTALNLNLNGHNLTLNGTGNIAVGSMIGNAGGDTGSVTLVGGADNTRFTFAGLKNNYTGDTTLERGILRLQVDPGGIPAQGIVTSDTAIRGNLTIGTGSTNSTATAQLYYSNQIADNAEVTIKSDGTLDLGTYGAVDTLGHIKLQGGTISTVGANQGVLKLGGVASGNDIDVTTSGTSTISGRLDLNNVGGSARTINVASGSTLNQSAQLYGGSWIKDGAGTMVLSSDNTYGFSGTTEVKDGILSIQNAHALGQTYNGSADAAQTTVDNGATLQLKSTSGDISFAPEQLVLNGSGAGGMGALNNAAGNNTWQGGIYLGAGSSGASITADSGTTLTVNGSIDGRASFANTQTLTVGGSGNTTLSGPISDGANGGTLALTKTGSGTTTLNGNDSFTGAVHVDQGTLAITANNVLGAQSNAVNVAGGATLAVSGGSGNTNTIGSLTGSGLVSIAASTNLKVNNTAADTFDGRLSGSGLFEKTGSGTFTFSSTANTSDFNFAGTVQLTASASTDTMEFQGGSAGNALSIGTLNLTGGTLLLTGAYINVGTLNITGNTILDFGTSGASILNAQNIYIAAGATLTVVNWTSEVDFLFANSSFRQNNGSGTLAGFNEIGSVPENQVQFQGDPLSSDGSHTTWINNGYGGFTNWEIRPIPEPSTYGAMLIGACLALLGWRRYRRPAASRSPVR